MNRNEMNEKLVERGQIIADMRKINDKALEEKRELTSEEKGRYDAMWATAEVIKTAVAREELLNAAHRDNAHTTTPIRPTLQARETGNVSPDIAARKTPEYTENFMALLRGGEARTPTHITATLQKAVNTQGGYLVPIDFEDKIVLKMYNSNIMRQICSVLRTTSQVNIPMEGALPVPGWIDELGTYPATDASVAQAILSAYKLGAIMTVSEELLNDAFIDVATYIAGRAALAFGFTEEAAFIGGDGNKKPTGVLTTALATPGNTTVTAGTATKVQSADVVNLYYGLGRAYRANASFVLADTAMLGLRNERATTGQFIGQYLFSPSTTVGVPDTLLNKPVYTSDFLAPVSHLSVSAFFGDMSYYQIVDRVGWSMQTLQELYAANGQIGYRIWERTDGKLLRPEAVVTLTQP